MPFCSSYISILVSNGFDIFVISFADVFLQINPWWKMYYVLALLGKSF